MAWHDDICDSLGFHNAPCDCGVPEKIRAALDEMNMFGFQGSPQESEQFVRDLLEGAL